MEKMCFSVIKRRKLALNEWHSKEEIQKLPYVCKIPGEGWVPHIIVQYFICKSQRVFTSRVVDPDPAGAI